MAFCPNCGAQVEDGVAFCPQCGTGLNGAAPMPPIDIYDHTVEFHPQDISDNKVYAMLCYLMGTIGIIIALLASAESPYLKFHIRQAVKLSVTSMLTWIAAVVLCWTIIVPIAAIVLVAALFVIRIISFFQICSGRAVEPAIVRSLNFLR
jgi:uncharacterized membrane protein